MLNTAPPPAPAHVPTCHERERRTGFDVGDTPVGASSHTHLSRAACIVRAPAGATRVRARQRARACTGRGRQLARAPRLPRRLLRPCSPSPLPFSALLPIPGLELLADLLDVAREARHPAPQPHHKRTDRANTVEYTARQPSEHKVRAPARRLERPPLYPRWRTLGRRVTHLLMLSSCGVTLR